jgi:hypothetical protein
LLLEGLTRNWGFYFTARSKPDGIGSSDLGETLQRLEKKLSPLNPNDESVTTLRENRDVASHYFRILLYARMIVFRAYLACAYSQPGGITAKHKGQWLLLQIAPTTLLGKDVFRSLARALLKTDSTNLLIGIEEERSKIEKLVFHPSPFCVLDEAQIPSNTFKDYFLSDTGKTKRPILREIIATWSEEFPNLIVSGTGVSMQEVEKVFGSVVAKPASDEAILVTDVGAFDTWNSQKQYLSLYFPPNILDRSLASYLEYWLRGRYSIHIQVHAGY